MTKKLLAAVLCALSVTGCVTVDANKESGTQTAESSLESPSSGAVRDGSDVGIEDLKHAVTTIFPDCIFEDFSVENGREYNRFNTDDLLLDPAIMASSEEISFTEEGIVFDLVQPQSDGTTKFSACHSEGKALSSLKEVWWGTPAREDGTGWSQEEFDSCSWPQSWSEATQEFADFCAQVMSDADTTGLWVVIRQFASEEIAQANFETQVAEDADYFWTTPIARVGQFTIKFLGPFQWVSEFGIRNVDEAWQSLISSNTAYIQGSDVDPAFPTSYAGNNNVTIRGNYESATTCNNALRVSELDWVEGECGTLSVEVFQADLATGECLFLGKYDDRDGSERTGVFEFCNKFREGSFVEGKSYSVKVQVTGQTSYETKGGWEQEALTFDVIG